MSPRDDLASALALLTRIPVPPHRSTGAASAWAWPVAGALVGAAAALAAALALSLGTAPALVAVLVIAVEVALTGALHEDGLADTADGLWGGRDRARRLEIMKDSRIGTYGTLALVLVTLGRWAALVTLLQAGEMAALVAAAALSRVPMAAIMAALPNARGTGLAAATGAPALRVVGIGAGVAFLVALLGAGWSAIPMAFAAAAAGFAVAALARAKIGGQTGDILGASQQLALLAGLAAA
jgi:adenosylcobinamide-GDP ribazoletransferase